MGVALTFPAPFVASLADVEGVPAGVDSALRKTITKERSRLSLPFCLILCHYVSSSYSKNAALRQNQLILVKMSLILMVSSVRTRTYEYFS